MKLKTMFTIQLADKAVNKLKAIAQAIAKPDVILNQIAAGYEHEIDQAFDLERDPNTSSPWAELSPAYAKEKAISYPGRKKLVRTGRGKESIRVLVKGNTISVQHLDYMQFHRTGTRIMPQRDFVPEKINEPMVVGVVTRVITAIING